MIGGLLAGAVAAVPTLARAQAPAAAAGGKTLRVGMIGLDTSHVTAFTALLNDPNHPDHVPGAKVVAAFKGGSPDIEASATRIDKFTAELRDKWKIEIVDSIDALLPKVDVVMIESVDARVHLAQARPVAGRQVAHGLSGGVVLVDDSYNANPGSVAAAIDALAASGDEAWLVLGDMRELGPEAAALHADAGSRARQAGIARLYALGGLSAEAVRAFGEGGTRFDSHQALAAALAADLAARAPADPAGVEGRRLRVLVKGSRGSAMDRIVNALLAHGDATHAA